MKLTIWIPNYNWGLNLIRAIRSSVFINLPIKDFEILVIDNCSTDNSFSSSLNLQNEFQNLRVLSNEKNYGRIWNWNRILEEAKGDYVMFLFANDQISSANNISELIFKMEELDIFVSKSYKVPLTKSIFLNHSSLEIVWIESFVRRNLKYLSSLPFAPLQTFLFNTSFLQKNHLKFHVDNEVTADHEFWISIFNSIPGGDILVTNSFNILFDNLNTNRLHSKLSYFDMLSSELLTISTSSIILNDSFKSIYFARKYLTRINYISFLHCISFWIFFKNYKKNDKENLQKYIWSLFSLNKKLLLFLNIISYFDISSFVWFMKFIRNSWNSI